MYHGNPDAKVIFVSDFLRSKEALAGEVLAGERRDILINAINAAGILASEYALTVIHPVGASKLSEFSKDEKLKAQRDCAQLIAKSKANVIVPLGEYALKFVTGLDGIYKHHLSIYNSRAELGLRKAMPMLHPESIQKVYSDVAYIRFGMTRLKREMGSTTLNIPERKILLSLDCTFDEQVAYLENIIKNAREVSTDVETGNGHLNTVGLAISSTEAISIDSTTNGKTPAEYRKLWDLYRQIWSSENIGKIAQNGLFEATWASKYGIEFNNLSFDTMWAMKFLHPTLERGLDNVGRIYTPYPYWKDDHSDFNDIRNWRQHLEYCGKDAIGQFAARENMQKALDYKGLNTRFQSFVMKQFPVALEMQMRGLKLDKQKLKISRDEVQAQIDAVMRNFDAQCLELVGDKVNMNSHKQVKELLKAAGIKLPTTKGKETVAKAAILKLKLKYPKETLLIDLITVDRLEKIRDDYLSFEYDDDGQVRFSFDLASDESGVWIGKKNIFNKGFDVTGLPSVVKQCIIADPGKMLFEMKLDQPELRFIAEDGRDFKLLEMLDRHEDVAKYLASKMFRKPAEIVNATQKKTAQQVIKSANEFDAPKMFIEKCFARTGVFYTEIEAKAFMDLFLQEFAGCRSRIDRIKKELYSKRMLKSQTREIVYYDRVNESLLRKALKWGPDHHTNDKITDACFNLQKDPEVELLARGKSFVLFQVPEGNLNYLRSSPYEKIAYGKRWGALQNV